MDEMGSRTSAMTGVQLRALLDERGLTQLWLADKLKVDRRTVGRWIMGNTTITHAIAQAIRNVLPKN